MTTEATASPDAPTESDSLLDAAPPPTDAKPAEVKPDAKPADGLQFIYDPKGAETVFGKPDKDGRPENIAPKYWDPDKKAIKGDVVLNQLRWAEGKLGKKLEVIGVPEKGYALEASDKVPAEVIDGLKDDPRIGAVFAKAKELELSNKAVNEIALAFIEQDLARVETTKAEEIKKLGDNAPARLNNLRDFLTANLEPEMAETAKGLLTSAAAVQVVESLIKAAQPPRLTDKADTHAANTGPTKDDWHKFHFATNERGQRLVEIDPEYRKRSEAMRDQVFGTSRRDTNGRVVNG